MRCDECKHWREFVKGVGECKNTEYLTSTHGDLIHKGLQTGAAWSCADFEQLEGQEVEG